jgi:hypothetical protein
LEGDVKGVHVRDPNLVLDDLPRGASEIRITHKGRTYVAHSLKPWPELMAVAEKHYTDMRPIGGPAAPAKVALPPPKRRPTAAPRAMPYSDD